MNKTDFSTKKRFYYLIPALVVALVVAIVVCLIGLKPHMGDKTTLRLSSKDMQAMNYDELKSCFLEQGFTNVVETELEDLSVEEKEMDGMVSQIELNDSYVLKEDFDVNMNYPKDTKIEIEYHSMKKISPPVSSEEISENGYNYQTLKNMFEDSGFLNVTLNPCYYLVTGWVNDEGRVINVEIGSSDEFYEDSKYNPKESVIISYLAFKKDMP